MHFVHRVRTIWSWLPSFRAVAESEHLPTAAHEIGIVPSSLSRTVKQLEEQLGLPLFDRGSKTLTLNRAGRTILAAVREAMRIVDDALGDAIGDGLTGHVTAIATPDLAHALLVPATASLAATHPMLGVSMVCARAADVADLLLRGAADAAVGVLPAPPHVDLETTPLTTWSRSIYATAASTTGPFRCVVVGSPSEAPDDGWPAEYARQVVAWVPDERTALELCGRGGLATVAFDPIVATSTACSRLVRLAMPEVAPRPLYLTCRRTVGTHRRTEVLVEALRRAVRET